MEKLPVKVEWEGEGKDAKPVPYIKVADIPEAALEVIRAHYTEAAMEGGTRPLTEAERLRVEQNAKAVDSTAEELPDDEPEQFTPIPLKLEIAGTGEEVPAEVAAELGEGFGA